MNQESCIHLFPTKLVNNYLFYQKKLFLKTLNSEFSSIEVCFTDKSSAPLEMEGKVNITLITNWYMTYQNEVLFNWIERSNILERISVFFLLIKTWVTGQEHNQSLFLLTPYLVLDYNID